MRSAHWSDDLRRARLAAIDASSIFRHKLATIQERCPHDIAVQEDWSKGEWLGRRDAVRICLKCGYEEHCRYGNIWTDWPSGGLTMSTERSILKPIPDGASYSTGTRFSKHCVTKPLPLGESITSYRPTYGT